MYTGTGLPPAKWPRLHRPSLRRGGKKLHVNAGRHRFGGRRRAEQLRVVVGVPRGQRIHGDADGGSDRQRDGFLTTCSSASADPAAQVPCAPAGFGGPRIALNLGLRTAGFGAWRGLAGAPE